LNPSNLHSSLPGPNLCGGSEFRIGRRDVTGVDPVQRVEFGKLDQGSESVFRMNVHLFPVGKRFRQAKGGDPVFFQFSVNLLEVVHLDGDVVGPLSPMVQKPLYKTILLQGIDEFNKARSAHFQGGPPEFLPGNGGFEKILSSQNIDEKSFGPGEVPDRDGNMVNPPNHDLLP
jgi:hypothetical protein